MAPYLEHPAAADQEGYSVLGTVNRMVRDRCEPLPHHAHMTHLSVQHRCHPCACHNRELQLWKDSLCTCLQCAYREPAKKAPTSLQAELEADFRRVRETAVHQLNAQRKYMFKDTYAPADLNPYKRAKKRVEDRSTMIKNLQHKGTLASDLPNLRLTDIQVRYTRLTGPQKMEQP
jgi:hypothetical protein